MKLYKVYTHTFEKDVAVKSGWSWPAFFFNLLWLPFKRLWILTGIFYTIAIILLVLDNYVPVFDRFTLIFSLIISCYLGVSGNNFIESRLKRRGYLISSELWGYSAAHALDEFINRNEKAEEENKQEDKQKEKSSMN